MEDGNYLVVYLGILFALLSVAAFFVVKQVWITRRSEVTLSNLQTKLTKEKGTALEYYELGSLLLDKKLYAQAAAYLKKALKELPEEEAENAVLVHNALGYSYFAQDQFDLAIRQYNEALKIRPDYVTALNNLGHTYERKQLMPQALETYEKSLATEPANETAKRRADSLRKRLA
ncbi:tetratricopeptide repeat domain protein [Synechococcus sp. PCC 7335]|uniref:tetratricopeptide repeat protein n=1 Tax=Synechococcus sp. (strain ATCC 29403 / PCC 7335) TaxID=91464 RepID=UPI00017EBFD2|nr:tetratricopeptide repeat protein [Synechococcus sp. PCC 7335]EDX87744.1 tetratricopeptide repeat domain protein [Synechococcus sp. PCC 7335]